MEITRLISDSNPNSVKNQRHSSLPQILSHINTSHINTTCTLHHSHKGHLITTSQPPPLIQHTQQQPQSPTHGHVHRILSPVTPSQQQPIHPMLQSSMTISPIPLHHQQIAPTPQSTQIPLTMDLQHPPPQPQSQTHTPPNRRIAHILSEQKRRENINSGFEELKSIVPNCRGCADSKAVILRKAVHYIQTLESELQKLKQPGNSPTTPNAQTSPLTSPKSVHNTNGNLSLPPISSTLQAPPPQTQMPIHGNANGYALSDYNQRLSDEKNTHQAELMVEQKPQQYASQWQSNRINYQNYNNNHEPSSHQSHYQHRQSYQQHSYNHQKSLVHPIPRHHSQYYNENLKSENLNWNSAGEVGGNRYNYY